MVLGVAGLVKGFAGNLKSLKHNTVKTVHAFHSPVYQKCKRKNSPIAKIMVRVHLNTLKNMYYKKVMLYFKK